MTVEEIILPILIRQRCQQMEVDPYRTPFGVFLPELRAACTAPIDYARLPKRARSYIGVDHVVWGDIAERSVDQFFLRPNVGRLTLEAFLDVLAAIVERGEVEVRPWVAAPSDGSDTSTPESAWSLIAAWGTRCHRSGRATTLREVLARADEAMPTEVRDAVNRLLDERFAAAADEPVDVLSVLQSGLGHQVADVLVRRLWRDEKVTLDEIARERGCTREWIRLQQKNGESSLNEILESHDGLRWAVHDVRTALGSVTTPALMSKAVEAIGQAPGTAAAQAVLWMAGPFRELVAGVFVAVDHEVLEGLNEVLSRLESSPMEAAELRAALQPLGVHDEVIAPMVESWGRARQFHGTWYPWHGSLPDKAAVVLEVTQEPMTALAIVEMVGEGHSHRSCGNVLSADPRFVRTSKGHWGLSEWDVPEYLGIADLIFTRIEEGNGRTNAENLRHELIETFGVAPASVTLYFGTLAFVVEDGFVRRRTPLDPWPVSTSLESAGGVFRVAEEIRFLAPVNHDLLRGSGRPIPQALALALKVTPGARRTFRSAAGDRIVVGWRTWSTTGPDCGSVRALAIACGAAEGDQLLLRFRSDEATIAAELIPSGASAADALARLLGPSPGRAALAQAIGVEESAIDATLIRRGDSRISNWLAESSIT